MSEFDVFISNYLFVDMNIFKLWVHGFTSAEAVSMVTNHEKEVPTDIVKADVEHHYRSYDMLEKSLHNPSELREQTIFQLEPRDQVLITENYYELSPMVVREFLGKKLSSKHGKDLDEVSSRTGVSLKSCRRQYDNVRRIFKRTEELPGKLEDNISKIFLLSESLSTKYAVLVFAACLHFDTTKRKLRYLTFSDFFNCITIIMTKWTHANVSIEFDIDREFLLDLRDLKILVNREKELKQNVCKIMKCKVTSERRYQDLETNFLCYSRGLLGTAANLHKPGELRMLFADLVEKCVDNWRNSGWSMTDVTAFLDTYEKCVIELDASFKNCWERYMYVVSRCIIQMCHFPAST